MSVQLVGAQGRLDRAHPIIHIIPMLLKLNIERNLVFY